MDERERYTAPLVAAWLANWLDVYTAWADALLRTSALTEPGEAGRLI